MSIRYLGQKNGNTYADKVGSGVVVRVEPGIARGWEYSGEIGPDPEILVFPGVHWPPP